jgi:hypothetical protein
MAFSAEVPPLRNLAVKFVDIIVAVFLPLVGGLLPGPPVFVITWHAVYEAMNGAVDLFWLFQWNVLWYLQGKLFPAMNILRNTWVDSLYRAEHSGVFHRYVHLHIRMKFHPLVI